MFGRQGAVVARRFDPARRELSGDPVTVAASVALGGAGARAALSVSATGVVAYRIGGTNPSQLAWFDRSGKALGTIGEPDRAALTNVSLSPDGRTGGSPADGREQHRRLAHRFGQNDAIHVGPESGVVPDLVAGRHSTHLHVRTRPANWTRPKSPERCRHGRIALRLSTAQVSGRLVARRQIPLVCGGQSDDRQRPLGAPEGWRQEAVPVLDHELLHNVGTILARWTVGGVPVQRIRAVRGLRPPVSRTGWAVDGLDIGWRLSTMESGRQGALYLAPDGRLMAAPVAVTGATFNAAAPVALFQTRIVGGGASLVGYRQQYNVASDGRFLINVTTEQCPSSHHADSELARDQMR